jgi:hypothetical protein
MWHTFFDAVNHDGGETAPASPAGGVACPAKELMRRDGRFVGRLLRVSYLSRKVTSEVSVSRRRRSPSARSALPFKVSLARH